MAEPGPPTNARLIVDDDVIPVELVYEGVDSWGKHSWKAAWPIHVNPRRHVKFDCDEMPDDTTVSVAFGMEGFESMWGSRG